MSKSEKSSNRNHRKMKSNYKKDRLPFPYALYYDSLYSSHINKNNKFLVLEYI